MPELIYDIKFKVNQIDKIAGADQVNDQIKDLGDNLEDTEKKTKGLNKSLAISNQALFSFSDLVQDSAQFGQGFEQGMRAIGNNVGFTAELIGNLNTKVKTHNDGLSDLEKQQGKSTSVLKELQRSFFGVGGVILSINVAVLAAQFLFRKLDDEIKEITASAVSQAEALGEVAKAFADLDTGVPDPFGLRARALEIQVLSEQVEDISKSDAIKRFFEEVSGSFVASILPFKGAALEVGTFFGNFDEAVISTIEKNEDLRKQVQELTTTQEGYIATLQTQNPALAEYVRLTGDLEKLLVEQATGIELTDASFVSLSVAIQDQINILGNLETRTIKEASILTKLGQLLEIVTQKTKENNEANKERLEGLFKAFKFTEQARLSAEDNIKILAKRLDVVKTVDKEERVIAEGELERLQINLNANKKIANIKKKFTDEGLTDEQAAARASQAIKQINAERDLEIQISNQNQSLELKKVGDQNKLDAERDALKSLQDIREKANAEFAAKEAEFSLRLFKARGQADEKNIQEQVARDRFKAQEARINADKTIEEDERVFLITQARSKRDLELLQIQANAERLVAQQRVAAQDMAIQGAQAASALLQGLFGENKKIAIAEALVSTYFSAQKAYESQFKPLASIDSPVRGAAAAAIAVAQGLARVAAIRKTSAGGGGGGGGRSGGGGGGIGSRTRASGLFGTTDTASGSPLNNQPLFTPNASEKNRGIAIVVNNTFDDRTVASVASNGNDQRREGAVSGLGP